MKVVEVSGTLAFEAGMQLEVQNIFNRTDSDDGHKRVAAGNKIASKLKQVVKKECRLFFGTDKKDLQTIALTSSVAEEELHDCCLDH